MEDEESPDVMEIVAGATTNGHDDAEAPPPAKRAKITPVREALRGERQLMSVEYPGLVRNVDKAIANLGGLEAIAQAAHDSGGTPSTTAANGKEKTLSVSLRPSNIFAHPLQGRLTGNESLLVRVKPNPSGEGPSKVQIEGVVSSSWRFRGMADYQYVGQPDNATIRLGNLLHGIPDNTVLDPPLIQMRPAERNEQAAKAVEAIVELHVMDNKELLDDKTIAPPVLYSATDMEQPYNFRQNPSARNNPFGIVAVADAVSSSNKRTVAGDLVPAEPDQAALQAASEISHEIKDALAKMFEERPLWSKTAICSTIPGLTDKAFRQVINAYAYLMGAGPWRHVWCRFGYNPVEDPSSRIYQHVLMRAGDPRKPAPSKIKAPPTAAASSSSAAATTAAAVSASSAAAGADESDNDANDEDSINIADNDDDTTATLSRPHILDKDTPSDELQNLYQLCDVEQAEIKALIMDPTGWSDTYDKKLGFYTKSTMNKLRTLLKLRVQHGCDFIKHLPPVKEKAVGRRPHRKPVNSLKTKGALPAGMIIEHAKSADANSNAGSDGDEDD